MMLRLSKSAMALCGWCLVHSIAVHGANIQEAFRLNPSAYQQIEVLPMVISIDDYRDSRTPVLASPEASLEIGKTVAAVLQDALMRRRYEIKNSPRIVVTSQDWEQLGASAKESLFAVCKEFDQLSGALTEDRTKAGKRLEGYKMGARLTDLRTQLDLNHAPAVLIFRTRAFAEAGSPDKVKLFMAAHWAGLIDSKTRELIWWRSLAFTEVDHRWSTVRSAISSLPEIKRK